MPGHILTRLGQTHMVRGIKVEAVDHVPRAVIAVGNHYPDGHIIPPHSHRRGQLIFGATGVLILSTPDGAWVMPPQRGMWIPAGVEHNVRIVGDASIQSIYLEPDQTHGMPARCRVVGLSKLMRNLIAEAVDLPVDYSPDSRAGALMALIQHEMRQLPQLPLSLTFPTHTGLAERCRAFLAAPDAHATIDDWCAALGMSRRAFTRLFRAETGASFVAWRQQACLVAALPRLVAGESVTSVALALGYDNPAAFTTMFKRILGAAPRAYFERNDS